MVIKSDDKNWNDFYLYDSKGILIINMHWFDTDTGELKRYVLENEKDDENDKNNLFNDHYLFKLKIVDGEFIKESIFIKDFTWKFKTNKYL